MSRDQVTLDFGEQREQNGHDLGLDVLFASFANVLLDRDAPHDARICDAVMEGDDLNAATANGSRDNRLAGSGGRHCRQESPGETPNTPNLRAAELSRQVQGTLPLRARFTGAAIGSGFHCLRCRYPYGAGLALLFALLARPTYPEARLPKRSQGGFLARLHHRYRGVCLKQGGGISRIGRYSGFFAGFLTLSLPAPGMRGCAATLSSTVRFICRRRSCVRLRNAGRG